MALIKTPVRILNALRLFDFIAFPLRPTALKYYRILAVFFLCFNCKSAKAQYFFGPIASALGGAGRGAISSSEAPFINPASLAHFKDFHLAAFHKQSDLGLAGSQRTHAGILVDHNPEAIVPASVSYVQNSRFTSNSVFEESDWQLSFGNFLFGQTSFGIAGRYFLVKERGGLEQSNWNGIVGLLHNPTENLGIGLVGYNIFASDLPQTQPGIALGINYIFRELLRYRLDLYYPQTHNPERRGVVMSGFESVLIEDFFFRAGMRWDDLRKTQFFTTGLGWNGPKIGFDYAFEKNLRSAEELSHSFDLRVYF